MYMLRNELNCVELEEYAGRDGTLTLEEVWKPRKQPSDKKNPKNSKYFGPADEQETAVKVHMIIFNLEK